jgi:hypothetical protein
VRQIFKRIFTKKEKLFLICWFQPNTYETITTQIYNIQKKSHYHIDIFNTYRLNPSTDLGKINIRLDKYSGIIIHNTVAYNIDYLRSLDTFFSPNLSRYPGIKVLMKQDETFRVHSTINLLKEWQINLLLTCVPKEHVREVYPINELSGLNFFHTLTGYVSDELRSYCPHSFENRQLDVCYRGMKLPFFFGKLSYEKYEIGEKFKEVGKKYNLRCDISSEQEDRVYGKAWLKFLGNSIATLSVESGSCIFDSEGEIEKKTDLYLSQHPNACFEKVWESILAPYENAHFYAQVSPRHFEAVATKTLQIMYDGKYSNIFLPGRHYIALKKDFSNVEEVMKSFFDRELVEYITQNAFEDILMNDAYSYDEFIKNFDQQIRELE